MLGSGSRGAHPSERPPRASPDHPRHQILAQVQPVDPDHVPFEYSPATHPRMDKNSLNRVVFIYKRQ
jgi:hypothetical protein